MRVGSLTAGSELGHALVAPGITRVRGFAVSRRVVLTLVLVRPVPGINARARYWRHLPLGGEPIARPGVSLKIYDGV